MPTPPKVPWQPAPVPGLSQASFEFGDLLGARGDSIGWGRLLSFFVAQTVADLVWLVVQPLTSGSPPPLDFLLRWGLMGLLGNLLLTGVALGAFRWIPNALLAAPAAAFVFTLLMLPVRLLVFSRGDMPDHWRFFAYFQANSFTWTALFLLGLAMAVRWLKPVWLALLVGAVASSLGGMLAGTALSVAILQGRSSLRGELVDAAYNLAGALLFAGVFWGGLQLPWAKLEPIPVPGGVGPGPIVAGPQRLSKGFYLGSLGGAFGAALLLLIVAFLAIPRQRELAFSLLAVVGLLALYGGVVNAVLWYKMWVPIQDGYARTTPGKAIGFLFIPFYNLYWAFQALWGWAKDYNTYLTRHSLNLPRMPEGLFLAYPILVLTTIIPLLGLLSMVAAVVVMLMMAAKICDGVNALPPAGRGPA